MNKKNIFIFLFFMSSLILVGCSKSNEKEPQSKNNDIIKSQKLDLGEEFEEIHDIQKKDDGSIIVGVSEKNGYNSRIFSSEDGGKTWKKESLLTEKLKSDKSNISTFKISNNGSVFVQTIIGATNYNDIFVKPVKYTHIASDGETSNLEIDLNEVSNTAHFEGDENQLTNKLVTINYVEKNLLLASDLDNNIHLIDLTTGKIVTNYKLIDGMDGVSHLSLDDKFVYVSSVMGFSVYERNSGNLVTESNIEQIVFPQLEKAIKSRTNIECSITKNEKNKYYFTNGQGVFSYINAEKEPKEIINFDNLDMSLSNSYVSNILVLNDEKILFNLTNDATSKQELFIATNFTGKEALKLREKRKKLNVWMLYESSDINSIIEGFKSIVPNTDIEVQIGINNESSVTVSDAINNLNTKILANNGPDVIFMDGLPIDSYIDKKMLLDLSDIYPQNELFNNISKSYKVNDELYTIPYVFSYLNVIKDKKIKENLDTTAKLITFIKENPNKKIQVENKKNLASFLYYSSLNKWFDGKQINKEELKKFFEEYEELMKLLELDGSDDILFYKDINFFVTGNFYLLSEEEAELNNVDKSDISLDYVGAFNMYYSLLGKSKSELDVEFFNGNQYIPKGLLSVNSRTDNEALAKQFISYMLSDKKPLTFGLSINKKQFKNEFNIMRTEYGEHEISVSDTEYNLGVEKLEKLDESIKINSVIDEIINTQLEKYIYNQEDLDTVIGEATQKINLYINE